MKFTALAIPDDPVEWPQWLDRQLVSADLLEVVAGLKILKGTPSEPTTLQDICGGNLNKILSSGLTSVDPQISRKLVAHPELLVVLEDEILINGGEFWQRQFVKPDVDESHWDLIANRAVSKTQRKNDLKPYIKPASNAGRSRLPVTTIASLVACVLLMTGVWWFWPSAPAAGWGLGKSGLLTAENVSPEEFRRKLADAAADWFNKVPTDESSLIRRINAFDKGCQELLAADLPQLDPQTRNTIFTACRTCRSELENHLASLRAGTGFDEVLGAVNKTVRQLETAIRPVS